MWTWITQPRKFDEAHKERPWCRGPSFSVNKCEKWEFVGNLKFSLNDIFIQCDQYGEAAKAVEN